MIETKLGSDRRPAHLVLLGLAALAAACLTFGVQTSSADAACNGICVYTGVHFNGGEVIWPCEASVGEGLTNFAESKSAKNGCGGQYYDFGWDEGGSVNWKFCMSPGGERPEPGRFNSYLRVSGC